MRRMLFLLSFCLLSVPVFAQEPGIDLRPRFDALDSSNAQVLDRVNKLEIKLDKLIATLDPPKSPFPPEPAKVVAEIAKPKAKVAAAASPACPTGTCPAQANAKVASNYAPRWHNTDGKSLIQHIIDEHGGNPNASNAELYAMHDAWHDANGGAPPRAARSKVVQRAAPRRTVRRTVQRAARSCPTGTCPYAR